MSRSPALFVHISNIPMSYPHRPEEINSYGLSFPFCFIPGARNKALVVCTCKTGSDLAALNLYKWVLDYRLTDLEIHSQCQMENVIDFFLAAFFGKVP